MFINYFTNLYVIPSPISFVNTCHSEFIFLKRQVFIFPTDNTRLSMYVHL